MKTKRILSILITVCVLLSLVPAVSVSAETTEWEYEVGVHRCTIKDAGCKKKNAITVKLKFTDGMKVEKFLENTNGNPASVTITSAKAPWTLNGIELSNSSKDSLWMYSIWINVKKVGSSSSTQLLLHYPGTPGDYTTGQPIDQDDGGPASYSVPVNAGRSISGTDNFMSALNKTYYLDPNKESGTIEAEWSGKIKDNYVKFFGNAAYDCTGLSDAPTMTVTASGLKEDNSNFKENNFKESGVTLLDKNMGVNIDRETLRQYMNDNNMAQIQLKFTLKFDYKSTKGDYTFTATTTIRRKAFCVDSIYYNSNDCNNIGTDNLYYNNNSGGTVTATVKIKTTKQFSVYANQLNNKTVTIGEAYLTAGDSIKIPANEKSVTTKNGCFDLTFNIPDNVDSGGAGLTLVMNNVTLKYSSGAELYLWDSGSKKLGLSRYTSTHKIDTINPTVEIAPAAGVDLSKWNKTVTLLATPSEDIYMQSTRTQGKSNMSLLNNGSKLSIYYNGTGPAITHYIPARGLHQTAITLALSGEAEGVYDLVLSGEDVAGNTLSSVYRGIKLDNKAPEIEIYVDQEARNTDGTKSNTYNVTIDDASKTGRLYYMFTKSLTKPAFDEKNVQSSSGEMDTTLDRWAYIDQKDAANGVSAYIKVNKGENFSGKMWYFAVDEAGNKTELDSTDINITNEDTACDITPKNVEKPDSSYNITIDTNTNNTVYYRWKNSADNTYITEFKQYSGKFDTAADSATKNLNGTYILECKIVPPSGASINYVTTFVFDNEGPSINLTAPSADVSSLTQRVSVYATDRSDVASATGRIVNPDGTNIPGNEEFKLNVSNGILSQNVNISDIPSGIYALKVTAVDTHGASASEISDAFIIRNAAPTGTVDVQSELSFAERPLISSDSFKLCFDINEQFANPSYAKDQELYYRISTVSGEYGEWLDAGSVSPSASISGTLAAKLTVDAPQMTFADGANTLFVQTVICSKDTDKSNISLNTVKSNEIMFYYDNTAPTANLVINDYHTDENISGKLYVSDNLGGEIFISCESAAVEIGEIAEGEVDVTVSESTDTFITVSDASGNKTNVKLVIRGIDKTPPTADIEVTEETHGARKDAAATVKLNDVLGETVKFAFIPVDKYTDGANLEEYFASDAKCFKASVTKSEAAEWSGENNITYKAQILGTTGEWYLGVRAADSLGNSTDIVFNENVLKAEDTELSLTTSANPVKTETKTIATVSYNVPVYTLPQDKIVDANSDVVINNTLDIDEFEDLSEAEKVETANLELAKQYAMTYSNKYSFAAGDNGDYDLYTVDDLGRTNHLVATVDGVMFGAASDIKVTKVDSSLTPYADDEMICAAAYSGDYVIVEPADADSDTLLLPINPYDYNTIYNTNALIFESNMSYTASGDSGSEDTGYKKLVYRVEQIYNADGEYGDDIYADTTERTVTVLAFSEGADINDPTQVSEKTAVITGIDNTAPITRWSVSPGVLTYEDTHDSDGTLIRELVKHTTPGNVTFTITAQDKDSGIEQIRAFAYTDLNDEYQEVLVPMTDENGAPTEYWIWDGSDYSSKEYVYDEETGNDIEVITESIPVKVEYFGDADKYGVKMLKYTFSDEYTIQSGGVSFTNTLGAEEMPYIGSFEGALSTKDIIYKMPVEEGKDYNVKYYLENADGNWEEITDLENTYYKNAKAVIDIPEDSRGFERELYVANNSKQNEKVLNIYQHEFTFELRDKYGYTKYVPVSLNNFDVVPGEIEYTLETTEKTNTPYNITINASDNESGIGKVVLTSGGVEIPLTQGTDGKYSGKISKNGTYSITLYDKVGNKTVKSFNVKNIDTTVPTASVTYSTTDYTSRPVSATLYFSKQNVRITNIEPVEPLTSQDYAVNYSTSTITFTKSGTVTAYFEDDYGNSGSELVAVGNIDKTPPALEAVMDSASDVNSVSVSFNKVDILTSDRDMEREESDIYVTYGGITKTVADEDGNKNSFVFNQNGNYTFKIHDKEGLSSYLSIEITEIDTTAPKITSVSWSYDYDEFDAQSQTWVTKTANETRVPADGKVGYTVASDIYNVTNNDVKVTVETDGETRLVGSDDDYTTSKEKVYDQNGMFIFNAEKKNGLVASYGVDIKIIDKTPPTIDLLGKNELVFYENPNMNAEYDISMLKYIQNGKYEAYNAYDEFNGKKTDLTANVEIDWGGFNPYDLSQNTFDSSKPYTITYRVTDSAHNTFETKRTVRLVGMYDTIALVNGQLPDFTGTSEVIGDTINISLSNFSGTAYVRYQSGIYTMGQMKKEGNMIAKNENGDFEVSGLDEGWYTFYIQTDKRDYFTLNVYLSK